MAIEQLSVKRVTLLGLGFKVTAYMLPAYQSMLSCIRNLPQVTVLPVFVLVPFIDETMSISL